MSMVGQFTPAMEANGNIAPFRFVSIELAGASNRVVQSPANDKQVVGIADGSNKEFDSTNHAEAGDSVRLQPGNVIKVETGAAIDAGDLLKPDANGKAVEAALGVGVGYGFARALQDAAGTDEIIEVYWLGMVNTNEATT